MFSHDGFTLWVHLIVSVDGLVSLDGFTWWGSCWVQSMISFGGGVGHLMASLTISLDGFT